MQNIRNRLEQAKGRMSAIKDKMSSNRREIQEKKEYLTKLEQAKEIIRLVGLKTQQQLQYHISDITSLALSSVFPEPYELKVEFLQRRNKTECDLLFVRDGKEIDPLEASGYGAVDVAAFALRIASWSMDVDRSRNIIILDEPMRFLSDGYQENASKMIKEVSEKLGIQFIIVTHEDILAQYADRSFFVGMKNKISNIKEIEN
jgi:chromosome segregation ATPase